MHPGVLASLALASLVAAAPAPQAEFTATDTVDVAAAAATARTLSPTSHVKGAAFDRIAIIYLETTGYDDAVADRKAPWPFADTVLTGPSQLQSTNQSRHPSLEQLWSWRP